jgi:putative membrane protein
MHILINILLFSIVVFVVAQILPKVKIKSFGTAVVVAIVYSLFSFFFGWILTFLSLPLIIITFGLFKFVINAFLLWVTDQFISDFKIDGFGTTLIAAFLITIFDWILKTAL